MARKLTTAEIVERFKEINSDKYDYSEFEYVNAHTKGKIICPKHGEFWQSSNVHLKGVQCPKCAKEMSKSTVKLTKEIVLERANAKHNNKYEYEIDSYVNNKSRLRIKCPIHGWFEQQVSNHLSGQGCPKCGSELKRQKMSCSQEEIIERFKKLHGDKYDYSLFEYKNCWTKSKIICPTHGIFEQTSNMHLLGQGCPKCIGRGKDKEDFIKEAVLVHGDKYDYSKSDYKTAEAKILIKCNKCGTEFWQKPWSHLQNHGCPHCKISKAETEIENLLKENGINYEYQKRFNWLGKQSLDFYLPKYNVAIECQGRQHFRGSRCFGHLELEEIILKRDEQKFSLCKENGLRILYYTNIKEESLPHNYFDKIYTDKNELLKEIIQI